MAKETTENTALVKANETILEGLSNFEKLKTELTGLAEKYKALVVIDATDKEGLLAVETARKDFRKKRIEIEKAAKSLRDLVTPISKTISGAEKDLVGIIAPVEEYLKSIEDKYALEKEKIKQAKEREELEAFNERANKLIAAGFEFNGVTYSIDDVVIDIMEVKKFTLNEFETVLNSGKKIHVARLEAEQAIKDAQELHTNRFNELCKFLPVEEVKAYGELHEWPDEKFVGVASAAKILKEEKEQKVAGRKQQLLDMGFVENEWLGTFSIPGVWSAYHEQLAQGNDKEWEQYINDIKGAIERKKNDDNVQKERIELHNQKVSMRNDQMSAAGLEFNGGQWVFRGIMIPSDKIINMSAEEWEPFIKRAKESVDNIKKQEEQDHKDKLEQQRIIGIRTGELTALGLVEVERGMKYKDCPQSFFNHETISELDETEWLNQVAILKEAIKLYDEQEELQKENLKNDSTKLKDFASQLAKLSAKKLEFNTEEGKLLFLNATDKLDAIVEMINESFD